MGFDWVWLLSVWQTGPAGQRISRANPEWRHEFAETLPDLRRGGHRRLRLRHHRLHRVACARRRRRARAAARAPPRARAAADARLRPQPHGARPSLGGGPSGLLRAGHGDRPGAGAAELHLGQANARRSAAGARPRPVLPRLARHAAAGLRQPGHPGGDDRRAAEDRRAVRRRALRHGDAGAARGLRADLGPPGAAVLARGDPAGAGAAAGLPLHGRGVLGPRVDDAAAGVRLRLRQAALRPPARRARAAGARAPPRRARLPGQARALPGKPRRAPRRRDVRAARARGRRRHHLPVAGSAILPRGTARGPEEADLAPSGPGAAGAP